MDNGLQVAGVQVVAAKRPLRYRASKSAAISCLRPKADEDKTEPGNGFSSRFPSIDKAMKQWKNRLNREGSAEKSSQPSFPANERAMFTLSSRRESGWDETAAGSTVEDGVEPVDDPITECTDGSGQCESMENSEGDELLGDTMEESNEGNEEKSSQPSFPAIERAMFILSSRRKSKRPLERDLDETAAGSAVEDAMEPVDDPITECTDVACQCESKENSEEDELLGDPMEVSSVTVLETTPSRTIPSPIRMLDFVDPNAAAILLQSVIREYLCRKTFVRIGPIVAAIRKSRESNALLRVFSEWWRRLDVRRRWSYRWNCKHLCWGKHVHQNLGRPFDAKDWFSREGKGRMVAEHYKWRLKTVSWVRWIKFMGTIRLRNHPCGV